MSRTLILALALTGCPKTTPQPPVSDVVEEVADGVASREFNTEAVAGVESLPLMQLLDDHWEHTMVTSPTWATALGDSRYDDQLSDGSPEGSVAARAATQGFLTRAKAIDTTSLNATDTTTLALFIEELEYSVASDVCHFEQWSISPRSNQAVVYNDLVDIHPHDAPEGLATLLARYQQIPGAVDDEIAQLRLGIAAGRVANAATVELVIEQVQRQLDTPVAEWTIASVAAPASGLDEDVAAPFLAATDAYKTALQGYLTVLTDELLPVARGADAVGLGDLPDGAACYQARVQSFTTLDRPAADIHQLGLDEMASIHEEFKVLGQRVFGTDDIAEIFDHLRTDEELLFETSEQVQQTAEAAVADAAAAMTQAFGRLPQAEVIVAPVPDNEAPYTTIAYYRQPGPNGTRPGTYYVNTYAPETRPRHEARVLAYHEAIPGHHLQIAIAQELPDLPAFRRHAGMTAFVEGWALYTERLSDELGLYPEDVDRLGMLSFDAWRAARLVVDTGIHSQGWTREQAEQYMTDNTPLATNNIANEVDRYISWPGQALAYKTGQLHIRDLRARAEEQMGDDFSLSDFHDVVLSGGAVSLPELTRRVEAWMASAAE